MIENSQPDSEAILIHAFIDPEDAEKRNVFQQVKYIEADEISRITSDQARVREAVHHLQVGHFMIHNRNNLLKTMAEIAISFNKNGEMPLSMLDGPLCLIGSELLNFCSQFRVYMEHKEVAFRRDYGKCSVEFSNFKNLEKDMRDKNRGYSILNQLRNFMVHHDMPEISINMSTDTSQKTTLNVSLDAENLLSSYPKWTQENKDYIRNSDGTLSLYTLLEGWDEGIQPIMRYCENIQIKPLQDSIDRICNFRNDNNIAEGGLIGMLKTFPKSKGGENLGKISLNISWLDEIDGMRVRQYLDLH